MEDNVLNQLESSCNSMLNAFMRITQENRSLRHKLTKITHQRAILEDKNQRAIKKIKTIMAQIKGTNA